MLLSKNRLLKPLRPNLTIFLLPCVLISSSNGCVKLPNSIILPSKPNCTLLPCIPPLLPYANFNLFTLLRNVSNNSEPLDMPSAWELIDPDSKLQDLLKQPENRNKVDSFRQLFETMRDHPRKLLDISGLDEQLLAELT
jgi:hypothetical protein